MTRTIPQIRERLHEIAREHGLAELHLLAEETKRRQHARRAAPRARAVTEELAAQVRAFAAANPNMPNRDVGRHFGIDGGRVSEILHGKRGEE